MSLYEDISELFAAAITDGQDNEAIVKEAYQSLLGYADADTMYNAQARIDYWVGKLNSGLSADDFGGQFLKEAESAQGTLITDDIFETNKSTVADHEALNETDPDADLDAYKAVAPVDRTDPEESDGDSGTEGDNFTLTKAIDDFTGTADDDTFQQAEDGQLSVDDTLDGGAGDDRLLIRDQDGATGAFTSTNIETIDARSSDDSGDVELENASGYTTLAANALSNDLTFSGIENSDDLTLRVQNTTTDISDVDFTFASEEFDGDDDTVSVELGGNDNAFNVNIGDGGGADVIETLNLVATANNSDTISLKDDNTTTLDPETVNISGSGDLDISDNRLFSKVIDASDASGDITLALGTRGQTVTGGSGDDTYIFEADPDAAHDIVEETDGGTDTISSAGAGQTVDMSGLDFNGTDGAAIDQIEQLVIDSDEKMTFDAAQVSGLSLNIAEDADDGDTTLDIDVDDDLDASNLTFTDAGGDAFDDGSDDVDIDGDAGKNVIVGTAIADTIDGGDGDDTITGGAGADSLTGGDGNDTFVFGKGDVEAGETLTDTSGTTTLTTAGAGATVDFGNLADGDGGVLNQIDRLVIDAGEQATFTGTQLNGESIVVNADDDGDTELQVDVAGTADLSSLTFSSFNSNTTFDDNDTIDINGTDGTGDTITGTSLSDEINGGTGDDTITGGGGADTLVGGAGDDVFKFGDGDVDDGETLTDTAGNTGIRTTAAVDFSLLNGGAAALDQVDELLIEGQTSATFTGAQLHEQDIEIEESDNDGDTTLDIDVADGDTVDLSDLDFSTSGTLGSGESFNDGSDIIDIDVGSGDDGVTLTGTTQADTIVGDDGNDDIDGDTGDDIITGGAGDDTISTGAGSDYVYIFAGSNDGNETITLHDGGSGEDSDFNGLFVGGKFNSNENILSETDVVWYGAEGPVGNTTSDASFSSGFGLAEANNASGGTFDASSADVINDFTLDEDAIGILGYDGTRPEFAALAGQGDVGTTDIYKNDGSGNATTIGAGDEARILSAGPKFDANNGNNIDSAGDLLDLAKVELVIEKAVNVDPSFGGFLEDGEGGVFQIYDEGTSSFAVYELNDDAITGSGDTSSGVNDLSADDNTSNDTLDLDGGDISLIAVGGIGQDADSALAG